MENKTKSHKKKPVIKLRDIVPKKDAKGGLRNGDPCDGSQIRRH
jgi:hypothetical protein